MSERLNGTVKWFDQKKGYGFISLKEGNEVFVHYSSIQGEGYRSLKEGQQVEFSLIQSDKGPQANDVNIL